MLKVNTTRIAEFTWSSPEGEIIVPGRQDGYGHFLCQLIAFFP